MIGIHPLVDAVPATLFGMLALWAGGSRQHWFVRTTVVTAALLVMLLIPAYEVIVEFGIEVALVVLGLAVWRRHRVGAVETVGQGGRGFRSQLSLATLLLSVVVISVVVAVAARLPDFSIYQWYECAGIGLLTAAVALLSTWLACGKSRWWLRLLAVPLLIYGLAFVTRWFWVSRWLLQHWITSPSFAPQYWQGILQEGIFGGTAYWIATVSVGLSILCAWLFLMHKAKWFDPFHEFGRQSVQQPYSVRRQTAARWAASAMFLLVSLFPLLLFYRLLTPPPIPDLSAPRPNGYDDLVAAGRMIGERDESSIWQLRQLSDAQIRAAVDNNEAALALAHEALQRDCRFPLSCGLKHKNAMPEDERRALYGLRDAYCIRTMLTSKNVSVHDRVKFNLDFLRLALLEARSSGVDRYDRYGIFMPWKWSAMEQLWMCRHEMSAEQSLDLAHTLRKLDDQRFAWEQRVAQEQVIASNSGWEKHLGVVLDEWAGADPFASERLADAKSYTRLRILILGLAIRAFEYNTGSLPSTFAELVPDYLPTIPADPYDEGQPLKYRVTADGSMVYSVGPNRVDDGGASPSNGDARLGGDLTAEELFPSSKANQSQSNAVDANSDAE